MSGETFDLWDLERVRMLRTNRGWILLGVYGFFGAIGPPTARYLAQILESIGGTELSGLNLPAPTAADGLTQFTSNAAQLGVLAVVIVAASALVVDRLPEFGAFLRTRAPSVTALLVPRVATVAATAVLALVAGTLVAVVLTGALLGGLDPAGVVVGTLYGGLYLVFAVCLTAAVGARLANVLTTVFVSIGTLISLPILSLVPALGRWVPSELVGAIDQLIRGAPLARHVPAALAAVVSSAGLVLLAVRWTESREPRPER